MSRLSRRLAVLATVCFIVSALLWNQAAALRGTRVQAAPPAPEQVVQQAWQQAQAAGAYHFASDVQQTIYPALLTTNAGQSPRMQQIYLDGQTDVHTAQMTLRVWKEGSLANPQDGLEVRVNGDQAEGRVLGSDVWEPVDNFTGLFAPNGDALAFMRAAKNIRVVDNTASNSLRQYQFELDGPTYARYLRDQLEAYLLQTGQLPPSMSLDTAQVYRDMSGTGEVWIGADGLPVRLVIQADFPEQKSGERVALAIKTDFTEFAPVAVSAHPIEQLARSINAPITAAEWQLTLTRLGALLGGLGFTTLLIINGRNKKLYALIAVAVIVALISGPLVQSERVAAFYEQQTAQAADVDAQQAAAQKEQTALNSQWDPHQPADLQGGAEPIGVAAQPLVVNQLLAPQAQDEAGLVNQTDTDNDGLIDEKEAVYKTDPKNPDTDGDTLLDGVEALKLGTDARNQDTDGDLITDNVEAGGWTQFDRSWYTDPRNPDTNQDGRTDGSECPEQQRPDAKTLSQPKTCRDLNANNVPDVFDRDNDGDAVPDRVDQSANLKLGPFTSADPFRYDLKGFDARYPVLADLQIRPVITTHLQHALHPFDWPNHDELGQIKSVTDTQIRLIPLVEIRMSGAAVPLPRTTPHSFVSFKSAQTGWLSATVAYTQTGADTAWQLISASGALTIKLYAGECVSGTVAPKGTPQVTWANVAHGETRTLPDTRLFNLSDGAHAIVLEQGAKARCALLPELPHGLDQSRMFDIDALGQYGVSVRDADKNGTVLIYVPANVIDDESGGQRVAFNAHWPYVPERTDWGATHEARLVWMAQASHKGEWDQIVQVYYDDFTVTGFALREDRGMTVAAAYPDPAVENTANFDSDLWRVSEGLRAAFVSARKNAAGQRDVTISEFKARFDNAANDAAAITKRWGLAAGKLRVDVETLPNQDQIVQLPNRIIPQILNTRYTVNGQPVTPAPTILFAREETYRSLNLADTNAVTIKGKQASFDFTQSALEVAAAISWAPYHFVDGKWQSYPLREYLDASAPRFREIIKANPPEHLDLKGPNGERLLDILVRAAQGYYLGVFKGESSVVEHGGVVWEHTEGLEPDEHIKVFAETIAKILEFSIEKLLEHLDTANEAWKRNAGEALLEAVEKLEKWSGRLFWVAVGLAIVSIALAFWAAFGDPPHWVEILSRVVGYLAVAVSITRAVLSFVNALQKWGGLSAAMAAEKMSKLAKIFAVAAFVIAVALSIAAFVVGVLNSEIEAGSIVFNDALAWLIATIIVQIILLVISFIPVIGPLIVAILAVIDVIWTSICELAGADTSTWYCSGLSGVLTKFIEILIHYSDPLIDNLEDEDRVRISDFKVKLVEPEKGLVAGGGLYYQVTVNNHIVLKTSGLIQSKFRTMSNLKDAAFIYKLSPEEIKGEKVNYGSQRNQWQTDAANQHALNMPPVTINTTSEIGMAGINCPANVYLTEIASLPYIECWGLFPFWYCYNRGENNSGSSFMGKSLKWDVLPASIIDFLALKPKDNGVTLAWGNTCPDKSATTRLDFPRQKDADGDGLNNVLDGGADPDDSRSDIDLDRLNDGFEVANGSNPQKVDTDGDGLDDYLEAVYGTAPRRVDTDGDGLSDRQELDGWLYVYARSSGSTFSTWVRSDPLSADEDLDSLNDYTEYVYGTHPGVVTDPTVLTYRMSLSEVSGAQVLLRFEEQAGARAFNDIAGHSRSAACATWSSCPSAGVSGRYGNAVTFYGSQVISISQPIELANTSFSVAFWAKRSSYGRSMIVGQGTPQTSQGLHIGFRTDDQFTCAFYGDDLDSGATYTDSNWHHYACTFDAATRTQALYRDGALVTSRTATALYQGRGPLLIGQGRDSQNAYFSGSLDEFALYTTALSASEVQAVRDARYNSDDAVAPAGALLQYVGQAYNNLLNRYAQGLLYTQTPVTISNHVRPVTFILQPGQTSDLIGPLTISPTAPSGLISVTQVAGAQVTDWSGASGGAALWLRLNEAAGSTTFRDSSGNLPARDATCVDGHCPTAGETGQIGGAVRFDGSTQLLRTTALPGANRFTVAFWAKAESGGGAPPVVMPAVSIGAAQTAGHFVFGYDLFNQQMVCGFDKGAVVRSSGGGTGYWQHWACTVNGGSVTIYRNGAAVATGYTTGTYNGPVTIGGGWYQRYEDTPPFYYYKGLLQDVRIYPRMLSAQDVNNLAGLPTLWLQFEGQHSGGGPGLTDSSGSGNSATCQRECSRTDVGIIGQGSFTANTGGPVVQVGYKPVNWTLSLDEQSTWTQAAWVLPAPSSSWGTIMGGECGSRYSQAKYAYPCLRRNGLKLEVGYGDGTQYRSATTAQNVLLVNTWNHVAATYDAQRQYRLYVNGAEVASFSFQDWPLKWSAQYGNSLIGIGHDDGYNGFNGVLDEVRFYKSALSAEAVKNLYQFSVPVQLRLDEPAGAGLSRQGFVNDSDTSGGSNGQCVGGDATCPVSGLAGRVNLAAGFDGVDDAIKLVKPPALANHSFSIGFWANRDQLNRWDMAVGQAVSNVSHQSLHIGFRDNNHFTCAFWANDLDTVAYTDTDWHHWVCTFDAATRARKIYRDGMEVAADTASAPYQGSGDLLIGSGPLGAFRFDGLLDEVRIFGRAITLDEVRQLYQAAPSTQFHLEETTSAGGFVDEARGLVGTCSGATCPQAGVRAKIGLGVKLDGKDDAIQLANQLVLHLRNNDYTMMAWIKPASTSGTQAILGMPEDTAGTLRFALQANHLSIGASVAGHESYLTSTATIAANLWTHVAVRFSGDMATLFINGSADRSQSMPGLANLNSLKPVSLGTALGGQYFNGTLDEFAIYPRGLTDTELRTLYAEQAAYVEDRVTRSVMVDNDVPASSLVSYSSINPYRPVAPQVLVATAHDATSGVGLVELGVARNGGATTWVPARECLDSNNGAAWCPVFDPAALGGGGTYVLQTRATDNVGYREAPTTSFTVLVDGTAPTFVSDNTNDGLLAAHQDPARDQSRAVTLIGRVWDAAWGGPASGVRELLVSVADVSGQIIGGTRPAQITGENWTIEYPVNTEGNGPFTARAIAVDKVGNESSGYLVRFYIDDLPAVADLYTDTLPAQIITNPIVITGSVVESPTLAGSHFFGVGGVDVAYEPLAPVQYNELTPEDEVYHFTFYDDPNHSNRSGFYDVTNGFSATCNRGECPVPNATAGNGALFDGVNDYLQVDDDERLTPFSYAFTVAAWVRPDEVQGDHVIFGKMPIPDRIGYVLGIRNGRAYLDYTTQGLFRGQVEFGTVRAGEWVHIAASVQSNDIVLGYINGVRVFTGKVDVHSTVRQVAPLRIGAMPGSDPISRLFKGVIRNVRLLRFSRPNAAENDAQVSRLFAGSQPAAHYRFDDWPRVDNGYEFKDANWNFTASLNTGPNDTAGKIVAGKVGSYALNLDGVNDTVTLNTPVVLSGPDQLAVKDRGGNWTVAFWAKRAWNNRTETVFHQGQNADRQGLSANFSSSGTFRCGTVGSMWSANGAGDTNWHHWACTYETFTGVLRIYRDGVEVANATARPTYLGSGPVVIGSGYNNTEFYQGALDDFRLYNRELHPGEVRGLYLAGWQPATVSRSGAGVSDAVWSYTIPNEVEGQFRLNLRASDAGGNWRITPNVWRTEIDTAAPRVTIVSAFAVIAVQNFLTVEDHNLVENGLRFPDCYYDQRDWYHCRTFDPTRTVYQSPWYKSLVGPGAPPRLTQYDRTFNTWIWDIFTVSMSGTYACDKYGHCSVPLEVKQDTLQSDNMLAHTASADLSLMLEEPYNAITYLPALTSTLPISGGALALNALQAITISIDAAPVYTLSWAQDAITYTLFHTAWTPTGGGPFVLKVEAADWATQTVELTRTIALDLVAPQIELTTTPQQVRVDERGYLQLRGLVTDTTATQVEVDLDGAVTVTSTLASVSDGVWFVHIPIGPAAPIAGDWYTVTVRASDQAGWLSTLTQPLYVDAVPPALSEATITLNDEAAVAGTIFTTADITASATFTAADMAYAWAAWTTDAKPPLLTDTAVITTALSPIALNTTLNVTPATDGIARYFHYGAIDAVGNVAAQSFGPIYHDLIEQPDYIGLDPVSGQAYRGWQDAACSLLGRDYRAGRVIAPGGTLGGQVQDFYLTRDREQLRFTWSGANWAGDGDLFIYLDTIGDFGHRHGSKAAYNPYSDTVSNTILLLPTQGLLGFVDSFEADYAIWVQDESTAQLLKWEQATSTWSSVGPIGYRYEDGYTDLWLPFADLAWDPATTTLGVVAFATDNDALRVWAAQPAQNPIDSPRTTWLAPAVGEPHRFALTTAYRLTFNDGECFAPEGRLQLSVESDQGGALYSTHDDVSQVVVPALSLQPELWETIFTGYDTAYTDWLFGDYCLTHQLDYDCRPEKRPAQRDTLAELSIVSGAAAPVLPDQAVTYTLRYDNQSSQAYFEVVAVWESQADAITWQNGCNLSSLGDVLPHAAGTHSYSGVAGPYGADLITATLYRASDINANVGACTFDAPDAGKQLAQVMVQHAPHTTSPVLTIDTPDATVGTGHAIVGGDVLSAVPLDAIDLAITPAGGISTIEPCTDLDPDAKRWACDWIVPDVADGSLYYLSARATDRFNLDGPWSPPTLIGVDTVAPALALADELQITDTLPLLSGASPELSGLTTDNHLVGGVTVCDASGASCGEAEVLIDPATLPVTTLVYDDVPDQPIPITSGLIGGGLPAGLNAPEVCGAGTVGIWRTFTITDSFTIADLEVGLAIDHPYRSDIVAKLWTPTGQSLTLIESYDLIMAANYNVWLSDAAAVDVTTDMVTHSFAQGDYVYARQPRHWFNLLNGQNAAGTWTLIVCDVDTTADVGAYQRSQLKFRAEAPVNDTQASWVYALPGKANSDNVAYTSQLAAWDRAANRAVTQTLAYRVDNVAPVLTVTQALDQIMLAASQTVLWGEARDGDTVSVFASITDPNGATSNIDAPVINGAWTFDLTPNGPGTYTLFVHALDRAGNETISAAYEVEVVKPYLAYWPIVQR